MIKRNGMMNLINKEFDAIDYGLWLLTADLDLTIEENKTLWQASQKTIANLRENIEGLNRIYREVHLARIRVINGPMTFEDGSPIVLASEEGVSYPKE